MLPLVEGEAAPADRVLRRIWRFFSTVFFLPESPSKDLLRHSMADRHADPIYHFGFHLIPVGKSV